MSNNAIDYSNETAQKIQNASITSLVLGICGIIFYPVGLILGIIGIIYAKKARKLSGGTLKGLALAGFICSIVSTALGSLVVVFILIYIIYIVIVIAALLIGGSFGAFM